MAPKNNKKYTIIPASKALALFARGVRCADRTVITAITEDLAIEVQQRENIAGIAGYDTSNGTTPSKGLPFNYTGSITMV